MLLLLIIIITHLLPYSFSTAGATTVWQVFDNQLLHVRRDAISGEFVACSY